MAVESGSTPLDDNFDYLIKNFHIDEEYYLSPLRNINTKNKTTSKTQKPYRDYKEFQRDMRTKQEIRHILDKMIKSINADDLTRFARLLHKYTGSEFKKEMLQNHPVDENGNTLLHVATSSKKADFFVFLLEEGADASIQNSKGLTPYQCIADCDDNVQFKKIFFHTIHRVGQDPSLAKVPQNKTEFEDINKSTSVDNKPTQVYYYGPSRYKEWLGLYRQGRLKATGRTFHVCLGCKFNKPQKESPLFGVYCSKECLNKMYGKYPPTGMFKWGTRIYPAGHYRRKSTKTKNNK